MPGCQRLRRFASAIVCADIRWGAKECALWICVGVGSGIWSSSCLAAGCSGSAQTSRFGRGTGACAAQVVNQVSLMSSCPPWRHRPHCLQWLRVWCYRRPEVPVELEWRSRTTRHDKTCCLGPSVSFFAVDTPVKTQCCGSHPCGPTVDRHSSVSSGVRYA